MTVATERPTSRRAGSVDRPARSASRGPAGRTGRAFRPAGYVWILPALVLCVGLLYYSVGYTGFISTLNWNGTSPDPVEVGARNFAHLLGDRVFWLALRHTVISFVVTFVVQTVLGVVLAAMLHSRPWGGVAYKVVLFVPVVLAPAITAPVFRQIFAADGELNWVLQHIGLGALAQPWLAQPGTSLGAVITVGIWQWTGMTFILYYAAMGQIDPEMLEAAQLDGAGNLRTLASIVWPNLRGTTFALLTLSAIGSLKTFDIPWLVTVGGPDFSTEFLGTMIYRQSILYSQVGYGAAISVMLVLLAVLMGIVINVRPLRARLSGEA